MNVDKYHRHAGPMTQNPYDFRSEIHLMRLERTFLMQRSLTLTLALLAAMALPAAWCGAQAQPAADHHLAIGVVRMADITRLFSEFKKLDTERQAKGTEFQQLRQRGQMELQEMQKKRDVNDRQGSQQWIDDTNALDERMASLDTWAKVTDRQLTRWEKKRLLEIYDHISDAAAQVAQAQHLDLVLCDQSLEIGPNMDLVSPEGLNQALTTRTVLFSNKKADITQDVLTQAEAMSAKATSTPAPAITPPAPAPNGH